MKINNLYLLLLWVILICAQSCVSLDTESNQRREYHINAPSAIVESTLQHLPNIMSKDSTFIDSLSRYVIPQIDSTSEAFDLAEILYSISAWKIQNGDVDDASQLLKKSYDLWAKEGCLRMVEKSNTSFAYIYYKKKEFHKAIEHNNQSLKIAEYFDDCKQQAGFHHNASRLYNEVGDRDKSMYHIRKAKKLADSIEANEVLAYMYGAEAELEYKKGDFLAAKTLSKKAYELAKIYARPLYQRAITIDLAKVYVALEEYNNATILIEQNEDILRSQENSFYIVGLQMYKAKLSIKKGNFDQAQYHLDKFCGQAIKLSFPDHIMSCEETKALLEEAKGNFNKALQHHTAYADLYEKSYGEQAKLRIASLNSDLQLQKKNSEIRTLERAEELSKSALKKTHLILFAITAICILIGFSIYSTQILAHHASKSRHKQKIMQNKSKIVQSQIDPEFIFNTIKSIQQTITDADRMQSYQYLGNFSYVLRKFARAANEDTTTIDREIELIQSYLSLESLRLGESLTFDIRTNINTTVKEKSSIPIMLLQPVIAEIIKTTNHNSKHTIMLNIVLNQIENMIIVEIESNISKSMQVHQTLTHKLQKQFSERFKYSGSQMILDPNSQDDSLLLKLRLPITTVESQKTAFSYEA